MANPSTLPKTGYVRLEQIIGRPARGNRPAIEPLIPVSKSTWFAGVQSGRFPAPTFVFGPNIAAYRVSDIRALLERGKSKSGANVAGVQVRSGKARSADDRKPSQGGLDD